MIGVCLVLGHSSFVYEKVQFETIYVTEQQDKIISFYQPSLMQYESQKGNVQGYHYLYKKSKCNTNIFHNYRVVCPCKQFRFHPNTFTLAQIASLYKITLSKKTLNFLSPLSHFPRCSYNYYIYLQRILI